MVLARLFAKCHPFVVTSDRLLVFPARQLGLSGTLSQLTLDVVFGNWPVLPGTFQG